jgi:hypothetical protein
MWQAMLTLGVAVIGFLGVALGAVVTGYVTLRQAQLATQREREAQQAVREQQRKDTRDVFQRESVLALQDAIEDMWAAYLRAQSEKHEVERQQGKWIRRTDTDHPHGFAEASRHVNRLRARIFDNELRDLANKMRVELGLALFAESERLERHNSETANGLLHRTHDRMHVLLKEFF